MTTYTTIDYLPDYTNDEMNAARSLTFAAYSDYGLVGWDNKATFDTYEDYAILKDNFVFEGKEGATYDIFSKSFFDPFILLLYDNQGNVIATDDNQDTGSDKIFDFVAPYTGKYYVNASWNQGSADDQKFVYIAVYENIDTIPINTGSEPKPTPEPTPTPTPPPQPVTNDIDRIFNWGESVYSQLFPNHQDSQDVFGYYARIYSNGDALGEKDGNIYYYDGGADGTKEIALVGVISDFLPQAVAADF